MTELFSAFALVFVAELGDKSQLAALGFGARYSFRLVIVGISIGYVAAMAASVAVGALIGTAFPTRAVSIGGGLLFLAFAIWTIMQDDGPSESDEPADAVAAGGALRLVLSVALALFVAEIGDKTMLTAATLATRGEPIAVFVGAAAGILAAGAIGVFAGRAMGSVVSPQIVRWGSGALFALFGVALLVTAV